jgi:hypothetical protein
MNLVKNTCFGIMLKPSLDLDILVIGKKVVEVLMSKAILSEMA